MSGPVDPITRGTSGNLTGSSRTHTNSASLILSPVITDYAVAGVVNVEETLAQAVSIDGIDRLFEVALDDMSECAALLNGFVVSTYSVDKQLGRKNPTVATVALATGADSTAFTAVMEKAFAQAKSTSDPSGNNVIEQYLANQLRDGFLAAFGSLMHTASESNTNNTAEYSTTPSRAAQAAGAEDIEPAANPSDRTVAVTVSTAISGFTVNVVASATAAIAALKEKHEATPAALGAIFRQIPFATSELYTYAVTAAGGNGGAAVPLITNALPLKKDDALEFVFDIDIANTATDVARIGEQTTGNGYSDFNMHLDRRRVALRLHLKASEEAAADGSYPVGAGGLREAQTAAYVGPASEDDLTATHTVAAALVSGAQTASPGPNLA